jgi:conjugative transfer signal peptidase TraF
MTIGAPFFRRTAALPWVGLSAAAVIATLIPTTFKGPPLFLWNASASVPVGLYLVQPDAPLHTGHLAVSDLPAPVRSVAAARRYLPAGVLLIKPIAAVSGATVCRYGPRLFIDGLWVADAKAADRLHRDLPQWQGCQVLRRDQIFLANPGVTDSFDGRYFGPTERSLIRGRAWPVLTFHTKAAS